MERSNKIILKLLLSVCFLMFQSCKDTFKNPEDAPSYEISGRLLEDCSMQPMANKPIDLFQEIQHNWDNTNDGGVLATTTTDGNGYFKFTFKDLNGGDQSIRYLAGAGYNKVLLKIAHKTSIDSLVIFNHPSTNIQVSINVLNPYTSNDTLVINDFRTEQNLSIPGPFTSEIIYTASNYQLLAMYYGGEQKRLSWAFYPNNGSQIDLFFKVDKYCGDTIFVSANIE